MSLERSSHREDKVGKREVYLVSRSINKKKNRVCMKSISLVNNNLRVAYLVIWGPVAAANRSMKLHVLANCGIPVVRSQWKMGKPVWQVAIFRGLVFKILKADKGKFHESGFRYIKLKLL